MDAGMPIGKKEDLPPPVKFPDPTGWQLAKDLGAARPRAQVAAVHHAAAQRRTNGSGR